MFWNWCSLFEVASFCGDLFFNSSITALAIWSELTGYAQNNTKTFLLVALWFLRTVTLIEAKSLETSRLFPLNSLGLLPPIVSSAGSDTDGLPWKLPGFKHDLTQYSQLDSGCMFIDKVLYSRKRCMLGRWENEHYEKWMHYGWHARRNWCLISSLHYIVSDYFDLST